LLALHFGWPKSKGRVVLGLNELSRHINDTHQ
jgi:hypothetical protein